MEAVDLRASLFTEQHWCSFEWLTSAHRLSRRMFASHLICEWTLAASAGVTSLATTVPNNSINHVSPKPSMPARVVTRLWKNIPAPDVSPLLYFTMAALSGKLDLGGELDAPRACTPPLTPNLVGQTVVELNTFLDGS